MASNPARPRLVADKLVPGGAGLAPALLRRAAGVVLDWDTRCRSRFETEDSHGRRLGVFLPRGRAVRGGDVLVAEDGSLVKVAAASQPVLVVRARTALGLLRAAYHLGNRHVTLEVQAECLQLEPDPVLADMLRRMGLDVEEAAAPFEPEVGAYALEAAAHRHDHDHGHGHAPHRHDCASHEHDEPPGHGEHDR